MLTWLKINLKKRKNRVKPILLMQDGNTLKQSPPLKLESKTPSWLILIYFPHLKPPRAKANSKVLESVQYHHWYGIKS